MRLAGVWGVLMSMDDVSEMGGEQRREKMCVLGGVWVSVSDCALVWGRRCGEETRCLPLGSLQL